MAESIQAAFVAAWNDCENPELDSENPHFRNKFASLKATLAEVRKACKPHGIAYSQSFAVDEGRGVLKSYVVGMGEAMELSSFPVECPPNPQSFGSNLTYAKRQQAQADWGITGEADDDAEAAAAFQRGFNGQQQPMRPTTQMQPKAPATAPQNGPDRKKMLAKCAKLAAEFIECGGNPGATDKYMAARFGTGTMADLTDEQIIQLGQHLNEVVGQLKQQKGIQQ